MTGIAGKSRGCTTCRRRRIKCDLHFPACQNCSRFGRRCEGYRRYAVFINRTPDGVIRRKPLEETELSSSGTHGATEREGDAPLVSTRAASPGPQIWSKNLEASRYLSWFQDSFVPGRSPKHPPKRQNTHWLHLVISMTCRQPTLDEALLAISLTRFGRVFGDSAILGKGQQIYAQALGLLQRSLYNEQLAMLDETLATVGVMILHELLETTSTTPEGWSKHVAGLASLLEYRGSQRHRALMPRKLFEHSRYMLMIHSISQRKASIFAEQEWQEGPWDGADKGVEQMIFDSGLSLGGLLETADMILKGERNVDDVAQLSSQLAEIFNNVHNLLEQHPSLEMGGSSKSPPNERQGSQNTRPAETSLSFPLKIMALGIKLTTCVTGYAIALKAADQTVATTGFGALDSTPVDIQTVKEWFNSRRITLARDICRLSTSYLDENVGKAGASRAIFPLRLAFEQLETSDSQYPECRALLQRLEGKGREYIPALNRNEYIASRIIRHKSPLYGHKEYR